MDSKNRLISWSLIRLISSIQQINVLEVDHNINIVGEIILFYLKSLKLLLGHLVKNMLGLLMFKSKTILNLLLIPGLLLFLIALIAIVPLTTAAMVSKFSSLNVACPANITVLTSIARRQTNCSVHRFFASPA